MTLPRGISALRGLRQQPTWRLLAADKAPVVVGLLHELLLSSEKALPSSVMIERLAQLLDAVRAEEDMPQTAQAYIAEWLTHGWLVRRLPAGASEEQYELSAEAVAAIRFAVGLRERRALATESRLSVVLDQLARLAEDTDPNPETRIAAKHAERARIDREIEFMIARGAEPLAPERALERAREIIAITDELAADFRHVYDEFDLLNRRLRQDLIENEGSRGDVLESLFAGVDVIGESPAGKTFSAFWRLLTDPEQSELLREAIHALSQRQFVRRLAPHERKFLLNITALLTDEGSHVHEVLQSFARSLKSFVQSREFLEQRRLHGLLKRATQAGLAAVGHVRPNRELSYTLTLTSSQIRSVAQLTLYDPAERIGDTSMRGAEQTVLDMARVRELLRESEIDFRSLRSNVRSLLAVRAQTTIGELLHHFPAEQGLGTVVGYIALGAKHGELTDAIEAVTWTGRDRVARGARIPAIHFVKERAHELVD